MKSNFRTKVGRYQLKLVYYERCCKIRALDEGWRVSRCRPRRPPQRLNLIYVRGFILSEQWPQFVLDLLINSGDFSFSSLARAINSANHRVLIIQVQSRVELWETWEQVLVNWIIQICIFFFYLRVWDLGNFYKFHRINNN